MIFQLFKMWGSDVDKTMTSHLLIIWRKEGAASKVIFSSLAYRGTKQLHKAIFYPSVIRETERTAQKVTFHLFLTRVKESIVRKKKKKSCTKSATVPVRREGQRESAAVLIFKFLNFVYVACPHEDASFERVKAHCDRLSSCGGVW